MTLTPFYDQSDLVKESIKSVRDAILIGLLLAAIILVLFLRDWGSSIVAGLVIPATIAMTFIALRVLGQSFNLMTLGGLAAAVGLVIDDAIVVVENIVMHRDGGQSRAEAIRSAMREIRVPLVGSTITPIVVFLPLISITGVTGTFFRALAITVGVALLTSLALALTWTPTLSHYFLRKPRAETAPHPVSGHEAEKRGFLGRVIRVYERVLRVALERPWATGIFCAVADRRILLLLQRARVRFAARDGRGRFHPGLHLSRRLVAGRYEPAPGNQVRNNTAPERRKWRTTSRRTGLQLGLAAVTEATRGDFTVKLKRNRKRGVDEVIADVRKKVNKQVPTLDVEFAQLLQDMIGDLTSAPEPIVIKMFSENPDLLRQWGPRVGDAIKKIQGVVDVKNGIENTISGPAHGISCRSDSGCALRILAR